MRNSNTDAASSCSPTSSRIGLIASRRFGDWGRELDHYEENGGDLAGVSVVLPTSDDPLIIYAVPDSSPRVRHVRDGEPRPKPKLPHSRLAVSP